MTQVVVEVVNVGQDWFTFVVPGSNFDTVRTVGRTQIPKHVDDALDYGLPRLRVFTNLGARRPGDMVFRYWDLPEGGWR